MVLIESAKQRRGKVRGTTVYEQNEKRQRLLRRSNLSLEGVHKVVEGGLGFNTLFATECSGPAIERHSLKTRTDQAEVDVGWFQNMQGESRTGLIGPIKSVREEIGRIMLAQHVDATELA
jgi:hypothetical protein